jgi:hypothetical protein
MAHTRCMLDKQGYMHACACTQINVYYLLLFHSNNDSRALLNVILYVYCLSCYLHKWRQNRDDAPGYRVLETRFYCHTTTVLLSLFFFISYVVPSSEKKQSVSISLLTAICFCNGRCKRHWSVFDIRQCYNECNVSNKTTQPRDPVCIYRIEFVSINRFQSLLFVFYFLCRTCSATLILARNERAKKCVTCISIC